jgi:hypothetical protein
MYGIAATPLEPSEWPTRHPGNADWPDRCVPKSFPELSIVTSFIAATVSPSSCGVLKAEACRRCPYGLKEELCRSSCRSR